jgi:hypothetical protein
VPRGSKRALLMKNAWSPHLQTEQASAEVCETTIAKVAAKNSKKYRMDGPPEFTFKIGVLIYRRGKTRDLSRKIGWRYTFYQPHHGGPSGGGITRFVKLKAIKSGNDRSNTEGALSQRFDLKNKSVNHGKLIGNG